MNLSNVLVTTTYCAHESVPPIATMLVALFTALKKALMRLIWTIWRIEAFS
jgi:hypothetical protein